MSLSRFLYEPFYSLADFDRLFDEAFTTRTQAPEAGAVVRPLRPRMDLHEDAKANTVTATFELPGLKKGDVDISVQNNVLTVSGESKSSSEREEGGYAIRERRYGKFSRAVTLPQGTKSDQIKAAMNDGVLSVTYPKTTTEQAQQKITVA
ncbi:HSP20-like chaperone [Sparassis latifolia]|uniref:Heat shock protein n=1 Tax=Sparassis crispa TaxID=139825 RepID=A0A401G691_9APHY|nr:Heat shock protein [Sparassis crispa]GBE77667.1 Heat shock protein [Sparassis crispa]